MAKTSSIEKNKRRRKLVAQHADKRKRLKAIAEEVALEHLEACVERAPRGAGASGSHEVPGECARPTKRPGGVLVLLLHDADGRGALEAQPLPDQREEDALLLEHVLFEVVVERAQVLGQASRTLGSLAVDSLHLRGELDQGGQLASMRGVVGALDLVHGLANRQLVPGDPRRPSLALDLRANRRGVEPRRATGLGQRAPALAAEVETVALEHAAGAWQGGGQLGQGGKGLGGRHAVPPREASQGEGHSPGPRKQAPAVHRCQTDNQRTLSIG